MKPLLLDVAPVEELGFAACVAAHVTAQNLAGPARPLLGGAAQTSGLEPIRAWLLGRNAQVEQDVPSKSWATRLRLPRGKRSAGPEPGRYPDGAILLKSGPFGWASPDLERRLSGDPTLVPVALVEQAWIETYPEYAPAATVAAWQNGLAAMARLARLAIVPSEEAGRMLARALARQGGPAPPIATLPAPSRLAGPYRPRPDPALRQVPYVIVAGPIESRTNVLLLLTVWRDLVSRGRPVPKLLLAGRRGAQIEEIKPMLDWNESLRPHVHEAADLSGQDLRVLVEHAAALFVPAFTADDSSLARDALALTIPVVASDVAVHREGLAGRALLLDPIDGCGWRKAAEDVANPQAAARELASPDAADGFAQRLRALLAAL